MNKDTNDRRRAELLSRFCQILTAIEVRFEVLRIGYLIDEINLLDYTLAVINLGIQQATAEMVLMNFDEFETERLESMLLD